MLVLTNAAEPPLIRSMCTLSSHAASHIKPLYCLNVNILLELSPFDNFLADFSVLNTTCHHHVQTVSYVYTCYFIITFQTFSRI